VAERIADPSWDQAPSCAELKRASICDGSRTAGDSRYGIEELLQVKALQL